MNDANYNKPLQSKHYMCECDTYIMMFLNIIRYIKGMQNTLVSNVRREVYYNI